MADRLRVCVIGNSHMAALRDGWPLIAGDHPGVEMSFFAVRGNLLRRFHRQGTRLIPDTAEAARWLHRASGVTEIETAGHDAFLLVGLWQGIIWLSQALHVSSIVGLPGPARMLVSAEAARAAARDAYVFGPQAQIAGLLRACWPGHRIMTQESPMLSAAAFRPGAVGASFAAAHVFGDAVARGTAPLWPAFAEGLTAGLDTCGLISLPQPPETVERHILTRARFRDGAPQLDEDLAQPAEDYTHMNALYGAAVLGAAISRLAGHG